MKILIVDDELIIAKHLEFLLNSAGYECEACSNPLSALETFKKNKFDAVITDFVMPEMNGIELMREIKKIDSKIRVIMITAYGDIDTAIDAINNKIYSFFTKPINIPNFMNMLNDLKNEIQLEKERDNEIIMLIEENKKNRKGNNILLDNLDKVSDNVEFF